MAIAGAASEKKALDIVIMKMRKMSSVCDYFVIASGTSTTHVRALSDNIIRTLKEKGQPVRHSEGEREASWILLDFGEAVCHLFLKETRAFYDLEGLWVKAPREDFKERRPGKPSKRVKKLKVKKPGALKRPAAKKKRSKR
ncbi:MAG: ribosome silencing factor [Candidatus Omnitrophica bacterium]|nr:ribosome silencing factor [Candidatus Omnitrophota bacterium]